MQKAMAAHEFNKRKALEPRVTEPIILPEKPERKPEPAPQRKPEPAATATPAEPAKVEAQAAPEAQTNQTATAAATAAALSQYNFSYDMTALYAAYNLAMPASMSAVNMMPGYSFPANVAADVATAVAQSPGAVASVASTTPAAVAAATMPDAAAAPTEAPTSSKAAVSRLALGIIRLDYS